MSSDSRLTLPDSYPERGVYLVSGSVSIDGQSLAAGSMAVVGGGQEIELRAHEESRVMVIGGEPVGERHIYWNFVSSSKERIEIAKSDWREGRFGKVPGDHESIPLPD